MCDLFAIIVSTALWSPRDHYCKNIKHHKGNPAEFGRADAEEVMMYKISNLSLGFAKWTFINVHF